MQYKSNSIYISQKKENLKFIRIKSIVIKFLLLDGAAFSGYL